MLGGLLASMGGLLGRRLLFRVDAWDGELYTDGWLSKVC